MAKRVFGVLACALTALPWVGGCTLISGGADLYTTSAAGGSAGSGGSGGTSPTGPNCLGLANNCGPNEDQDCCTSLPVEGGTYLRSFDGIAHLETTNSATVASFELDRYEVTVGRFRSFVAAGKGTQESPPAAGAGHHPQVVGAAWTSSWNSSLKADTPALVTALKCNDDFQTWTNDPGDNEALPINCVSWYEAFAFCVWDGGRLPTEAEWNYAAAGGDEQRYYPWSSPYPSGSVDIDATYAVYGWCGDGTCASHQFSDIQTVGSRSSKGDGRWSHADLAGSVFEWCLDWHHDAYLPACDNCANLTEATHRVERGGSFNVGADLLVAAARSRYPPADRLWDLGFRCARTPP